MREPSDLNLYYEYWNLALESLDAADRWRKAHEQSLCFWDEYPMVFPGFYRYRYTGHNAKMQHVRGQFIPVAIWLEQQIHGETGELMNDEHVMIKSGWWKPLNINSDYLGALSLFMAWEQCRLNPVTQAMYDFAMDAYARESRYLWFDTPEAEKIKPIERTELKGAPSLF